MQRLRTVCPESGVLLITGSNSFWNLSLEFECQSHWTKISPQNELMSLKSVCVIHGIACKRISDAFRVAA
jgi:hypothetical protein